MILCLNNSMSIASADRSNLRSEYEEDLKRTVIRVVEDCRDNIEAIIDGHLLLDKLFDSSDINSRKSIVEDYEYENQPVRKKRNVTKSHSTVEDVAKSEAFILPVRNRTVVKENEEEAEMSVSYVDGLESVLPSPLKFEKKNSSVVKEANTLTICDKSILLFTGKEDDQVRSDVKNSLLLAQLASDSYLRKHIQKDPSSNNTFDNLKIWDSRFKEVFMNCGFAPTASTVDQIQSHGSDASIDKVLLEVVENIGNEEQTKKFKSAIKVLHSLPQDDKRMQLFNNRTTIRDLVQLIVAFCYIDPTGSASLNTALIGISTKDNVGNILWFKWSDMDTKVYKSQYTLYLGHGQHDNIRPAVVRKLKSLNETFVEDIEC